jgi:hypothetical protein
MTQPALAAEYETLFAEGVIDRLLSENAAAKDRGSIGITCGFQAEDMIVLRLLRRDTVLPTELGGVCVPDGLQSRKTSMSSNQHVEHVPCDRPVRISGRAIALLF